MENRPNIILFFADDLGIGDVSAFNDQAQFKTEHIDKLAKAGIRFTDSHATSAVCTPSRYGLLTGRYNWRSRLKSLVIPGDAESLIEKDRRTIAQLLKDHGYKTAVIGKWHLGLEWELLEEKDYETFGLKPDWIKSEEPAYQKGREGYFGNMTGEPFVRGLDIDYTQPIKFGPLDLGFDYFYGTPASLDQGPFVVVENDRVVDLPVNIYGNANISRLASNTQRQSELGVAAAEHSPYHLPDIMQEKTMEVLNQFLDQEDPWFLYLPSHLVHGPIIPQERFKGKSGIGDYGDFVLQYDAYIGEVIHRLEEKGVFDETLIIFTSDNGVSSIVDLPALRAKGHDSSAGLRGHKMHIWEGGHREPTIVSYPPLIDGGQVSNHMVSHSDIYRTLADLLDADLADNEAEDSVSNLSLWRGIDEPVRRDIIHSSVNGGFSIRRDFWKLTFVTDGGLDLSYDRNVENYQRVFRPCELYDLRDDISETHNVIEDHPELVSELTQVLEDYIKSGRSTEGPKQSNQPDLPTGDWEQLVWMEDYKDYVESLKEVE